MLRRCVSRRVILVLTKTCAEDRVYAVQRSDIAADELLNLINEHLMCEVCTLVALVLCLADVAVIAGDAGDTEQAGLLVEKRSESCAGVRFSFCDERDNRLIKRASTGTYHEAVKRVSACWCR